jgi:hypothetical protein
MIKDEDLQLEQTYIYKLERDSWQKRLWFGGPKGKEKQFHDAMVEVEEFKKTSSKTEWPNLIDKVVEKISKHGFVRIQP